MIIKRFRRTTSRHFTSSGSDDDDSDDDVDSNKNDNNYNTFVLYWNSRQKFLQQIRFLQLPEILCFRLRYLRYYTPTLQHLNIKWQHVIELKRLNSLMK
jgi:hypothetical protein